MKKFLVFSILIIFALSFGVSAAAPDYYFNFADESVITSSKATNCTATYENGMLKLEATAGDPYFALSVGDNMKFSADAYPFAKICMKNTSTVATSEFYFGTDVNPGPAGPDSTQIDVSTEDADFVTYIIDMVNQPSEVGRWTGTVNAFRFDPCQGTDVVGGEVVYVKYIAFFKTQADAEAFDGTFAAVNATDPAATDPATDAPTDGGETATQPAQDNPKTGDASLALALMLAAISGLGMVALKKKSAK